VLGLDDTAHDHPMIERLNAAVKYSSFCSWQVNYSKATLTKHLFDKFMKKKQSSRQNQFPELRETVLNVSTTRTNDSHLDCCSMAPSISS